MGFFVGDVIGHSARGTYHIRKNNPDVAAAAWLRNGWRLLRTAREEWDAKHAGAALCGGMRNITGGVWPDVLACTVCGPRPTDPRDPEEIAALKAGKAAAPEPVATEWAPVHPGEGRGNCLVNAGGWVCNYCPASSTNNNGESLCFSIGPRYEHRWPSGIVGKGEPEFRRVATEPAPAVVEHVHLRELAKAGHDIGETDAGECPHCEAVLPGDLCDLIRSGTHDCPSCGWHSGRCGHCHEMLVGDYRIGERDHGRTHCPRCQGVD